MCSARDSRGNLGLQEDEDEDKQRWDTAGAHHPDRERLLLSHGVDEPASDCGVGHLNTLWHNQFLQGDRMMFSWTICNQSIRERHIKGLQRFFINAS